MYAREKSSQKSTMILNDTPSSAKSLLSLPHELLTQIALQLNRNSALSLALVSRALNPIADARIYRDLDLDLPPAYGEYPLIQPYQRSGYGAHLEWAKAEARAAEDRHREAMKEKVKSILLDAGKKRLGMVQQITVVPRSGAINAILSLLEAVSPNLRSLRIDAPADHVFAQDWRPTNFETIDVKLLGYGLTFATLTHLTVKGGLRFADTVILIIVASPSLVFLDASEDEDAAIPNWLNDSQMPRPADCTPEHVPILHSLRLAFSDRPSSHSRHPFIDLIQSCKALRQLVLHYEPDDYMRQDTMEGILGDLEPLRDMYWDASPDSFYPPFKGRREREGSDHGSQGEESEDQDQDSDEDVEEEEDPPDGFGWLDRLVVDADDYFDLLRGIPLIDSLRSLHILEPAHAGRRLVPPPIVRYPEPSPHPTMLPNLARRLRQCPYLTVINSLPFEEMSSFAELDEIEQSDQITGTVRGFRRAGRPYSSELIHARLYLYHSQISDTPLPRIPRSTDDDGDLLQIDYMAHDGSARRAIYRANAEGEWNDLTYFEGLRVPLEVISRMRKVQGATEAEWQGRGAEVGDAAWKVLTDWRDRKITGHDDIRSNYAALINELGKMGKMLMLAEYFK